jgi:histidine triad (HIT) family protein
MSTIFSKIIKGEIPCYKVAESADFLAFLDVSPVKKGHVLVIPKIEVDYIFDMEDQALANLHLFAKKVAQAVKKTIPCTKVGMAVVGLEVPHAHIHLIPMTGIGDLNFSNPRVQLSKEEFVKLAEEISSNFQ